MLVCFGLIMGFLRSFLLTYMNVSSKLQKKNLLIRLSLNFDWKMQNHICNERITWCWINTVDVKNWTKWMSGQAWDGKERVAEVKYQFTCNWAFIFRTEVWNNVHSWNVENYMMQWPIPAISLNPFWWWRIFAYRRSHHKLSRPLLLVHLPCCCSFVFEWVQFGNRSCFAWLRLLLIYV